VQSGLLRSRALTGDMTLTGAVPEQDDQHA
jgi:hypothetical protein